MRAVRIHSTGGPEGLRLDEVEPLAPAPGEAVVRLEVAGVNFIDVYLRTGLYSPGPLPARIGREGAGVVASVGEGVDAAWIGRRVAVVDAAGAYGEEVALRADRLLPLPDELDFERGAALPLQGLTAHYLVRTIGAVSAGDTVLVHAVAGGVGGLATQLAKRAGATVLGTCSTEAKAERARAAGCDHPILYTETDFAERALELTGGRGVDLVLDSVGKSTFEGSVRATRKRGTLVVFGQSSGLVEPFSPRPVLGSRTLVSASLADYVAGPEELAERWGEVSRLAASGDLVLAIDRVHPLADVADAHRRLEARETSGKVLLAIR